MKVKNIMFGGVMASILMMGVASAAVTKITSAGSDTTLATAAYVRGGVKEAEDYADQQIAVEKARAERVEGDLDSLNSGIAKTSLVAAINSVDAAVAGATSDASKVASDLADEVGRATEAERGLQNAINAIGVAVGSGEQLSESEGKFSINSTDAITNDSTALVTSGAVYDGLAGKVTANAAITGGTGTKITYDSKGLVTGSSALVAADIPTIGQNQVDGLTDALAGKQAQLTGTAGSVAIYTENAGVLGERAITGPWVPEPSNP